VEAFGLLIKFKMTLPWKARYQNMTGNITVKLCEVWSEFNIFCTLVAMARATILNCFNPPKATTHYGGYSYKVS
jgi:hypothetical protein